MDEIVIISKEKYEAMYALIDAREKVMEAQEKLIRILEEKSKTYEAIIENLSKQVLIYDKAAELLRRNE
jgi:uncharacterized protein YutE (UPF0331/DUF86 family)